MFERPDWRPMWPEVPEGCEVVAIIDPDWDADQENRPCRYAAKGIHQCGEPSVASMLRGTEQKQRWAYCPKHLYGRWVESGFVMHWILAKVGADAR